MYWDRVARSSLSLSKKYTNMPLVLFCFNPCIDYTIRLKPETVDKIVEKYPPPARPVRLKSSEDFHTNLSFCLIYVMGEIVDVGI
ncbi:MAG: hypothetical protein ACXQTP_03085 [Candidatus Methanofastidiosia archaeon]